MGFVASSRPSLVTAHHGHGGGTIEQKPGEALGMQAGPVQHPFPRNPIASAGKWLTGRAKRKSWDMVHEDLAALQVMDQGRAFHNAIVGQFGDRAAPPRAPSISPPLPPYGPWMCRGRNGQTAGTRVAADRERAAGPGE